jgi:hypothetical protein
VAIAHTEAIYLVPMDLGLDPSIHHLGQGQGSISSACLIPTATKALCPGVGHEHLQC